MDNENNEYVIWLDGQEIPVSKDVYREYMRYERKERYFMEDLKTERIEIDQEAQTVRFIPSREDSYERLLEVNEQFTASGESAGDAAIRAYLLERLEEALHTLSSEELALIHELFYLNRTVREVSERYQIAKSTLQSRKQAVLQKLWNLLERFF